LLCFSPPASLDKCKPKLWRMKSWTSS
jgi:hypothetical protein